MLVKGDPDDHVPGWYICMYSHLTHSGLVTGILVSELGHDWFRYNLVPVDFLNQCWLIIWTLKNKPQWNLHQNTTIFIQENVLANFVCMKLAFLFHHNDDLTLNSPTCDWVSIAVIHNDRRPISIVWGWKYSVILLISSISCEKIQCYWLCYFVAGLLCSFFFFYFLNSKCIFTKNVL